MKFNLFFFWLIICINQVTGQVISKYSTVGENYIQSLIESNNDGFIGLTTKDTLGYKNLMLVRLDDSLNISWTKTFDEPEIRNPVFLKLASTSHILIGSYTNHSALLMETDSAGIILNQWNINDTIKIVDAIRTANGATYFLFMKSVFFQPLGNLHSTGIGYINPAGIFQGLKWTQSSTRQNDPMNFAESNSNDPFFIIHRESLNYWNCVLTKTDSTGNLFDGHLFEIAYDIQLLRKHNLNYVISGLTLLSGVAPSANIFIQLDSAGNLMSINGIRFQNGNNFYEGLTGLKCVETNDGGLFCAGDMDLKIFYFKIDSNNAVPWVYSLPNSTNNHNVTTVLNCSDHGFLIEGSGNNTCELIRCDSNGISNCPQMPDTFVSGNVSLVNSSLLNSVQQALFVTNNTISFNNSNGNYLLFDLCSTTPVNEILESKSNLIVHYNAGILSIKCNGYSNLNSLPFELYDIKGKILFTGSLEKKNDETFSKNILFENAPTGMYLVKVTTDKMQLTSKFIKVD